MMTLANPWPVIPAYVVACERTDLEDGLYMLDGRHPAADGKYYTHINVNDTYVQPVLLPDERKSSRLQASGERSAFGIGVQVDEAGTPATPPMGSPVLWVLKDSGAGEPIVLFGQHGRLAHTVVEPDGTRKSAPVTEGSRKAVATMNALYDENPAPFIKVEPGFCLEVRALEDFSGDSHTAPLFVLLTGGNGTIASSGLSHLSSGKDLAGWSLPLYPPSNLQEKRQVLIDSGITHFAPMSLDPGFNLRWDSYSRLYAITHAGRLPPRQSQRSQLSLSLSGSAKPKAKRKKKVAASGEEKSNDTEDNVNKRYPWAARVPMKRAGLIELARWLNATSTGQDKTILTEFLRKFKA
jgi:hypothetical protein